MEKGNSNNGGGPPGNSNNDSENNNDGNGPDPKRDSNGPEGEPFECCLKIVGNEKKYEALAAGISTPIILMQLSKAAQEAINEAKKKAEEEAEPNTNEINCDAGSKEAVTYNFCKSIITLLSNSYDAHNLPEYLGEENDQIVGEYKHILQEDIKVDTTDKIIKVIKKDPIHQ